MKINQILNTQQVYNNIDNKYISNNILHIRKIFLNKFENYFVFFDPEKSFYKSFYNLSRGFYTRYVECNILNYFKIIIGEK